MSYFNFCWYKNNYFFNRWKLLQKVKDRYNNWWGKEKAGKYYTEKKDFLKQNARIKSRKLSEEEKEANRKYGNKNIENDKKRENKLKEYWVFAYYQKRWVNNGLIEKNMKKGC